MPTAFNFEETVSTLRRVLDGAHQLVIFRGILNDPVIARMLDLLELLVVNSPEGSLSLKEVGRSYALFFSSLAVSAEFDLEVPIGNPWQNHLLNLILNDENPFSQKTELTGFKNLGESLVNQVDQDLRRLQQLYLLESEQVLGILRQISSDTTWVSWEHFHPVSNDKRGLSAQTKGDAASRQWSELPFEGKGSRIGSQKDISVAAFATSQGSSTWEDTPAMARGASSSLRALFKQQLHETPDWSSAVSKLAHFYSKAGVGVFGRFNAFHWKHTPAGGFLQGIPEPDPIRLEDLIGCDDQKEWLVRNTAHFLAGCPANNVLVYGDRGTGKSSAIKALLHHFTNEPLRMLEISRDDLNDLPEVMKVLRPRREYFVLFIDDLSFEEGETQYKTLKAILEGSLAARPPNVLIYATSNRRHLIREYFSDRDSSPDGEVRHQDTFQEKVSLADRFGIQLVFVAPDQEQYLAIIHSMAERRGIQMPSQELEKRALQWAQLHNGRSGRTARQFTDFLTAELKLAK
jgi:uncharacterized protein